MKPLACWHVPATGEPLLLIRRGYLSGAGVAIPLSSEERIELAAIVTAGPFARRDQAPAVTTPLPLEVAP